MHEDGVQREAMRLRSDDSREAARLWFAARHVSGADAFTKTPEPPSRTPGKKRGPLRKSQLVTIIQQKKLDKQLEPN